MIPSLFYDVYRGRKVLVTGNSGFKGSWLSLWLKEMGADVIGCSIDEGTSPSHFKLLNLDIITFLCDIRKKKELEKIFHEVKPEIVFHLAAQALVRESYRSPSFTYETNIIGTLNVFEAAVKSGSVRAIINVTTDKVYENLETDHAYCEQDRLGGYDMYSSSKACSEILTSSYRSSFLKDNSILLASARAGNVIGGGDWAQDRLIPDIIRAAATNAITEIRNPNSIRPWEFVLEPISGYLLLGQKLLMGEGEYAGAWNFGPDNEKALKVVDVIGIMKKQWNKINFKTCPENMSGLHEAKILELDCTKAKMKLNWKSVWDIEKTIFYTTSWYKSFFENKKLSSLEHLHEYITDAHKKIISWTN